MFLDLSHNNKPVMYANVVSDELIWSTNKKQVAVVERIMNFGSIKNQRRCDFRPEELID